VKTYKIAPSVLNANFAELGAEVARMETAGADVIQWDVMDGHFVPNLTFGADVVGGCRGATGLEFEAHLMIENADRVVSQYVSAGCHTVIVHPEAEVHLHRTLEEIRGLGGLAGVALNPGTPLEAVRHLIGSIDHILVMTVNPGFGGQSYISEMEPKIAEARALIDSTGRQIALEVDGGISSKTIARAAEAGADTFVVGSALFRHPDGMIGEVNACRSALAGLAASSNGAAL